MTVTVIEVATALKSFRASSSGGVDGLRPGHMRALVSPTTAEAGSRLKASLTRLCNTIIRGDLPGHARDLLFAANLTALRKKDGGLRPIAVGNVFRRLASKAACHPVTRTIAPDLSPIQLGVGVKGGCEAAVHALRSLFSRDPTSSQSSGNIVVKLDMKNAFNSVRRDQLLEACKLRAPSIYPLAHAAYSSPSYLLSEDNIVISATGVQQGDPLGPLLFALAVDGIARSINAPVNMWYLDDATFCGPPEIILDDLRYVVPALADVGLHVNPNKSEIINVDCSVAEFDIALSRVRSTLDGVQVVNKESAQILGSPLLPNAINVSLASKVSNLCSMSKKLETIDSHPALFLLRNCFAMPKLLFTVRSALCYTQTEHLASFDLQTRSCVEAICNVKMDDTGWRQATLPVKFGGLGLRSASDISLSAYLSSLHSSRTLVQEILAQSTEFSSDTEIRAAEAVWSEQGFSVPENTQRQRAWDEVACKSKSSLHSANLDQHRLACFSAASQPYCGAWLTAIPSSATGTFLDNDNITVGVATRLGLRLCESHTCRCGTSIDWRGLHALSCRFSAGRFPRHSALNDIIKRALDVAGFPSLLEPAGLDRGDGKRPDGITVFPFSSGKSLVWDATCSDTFSDINLAVSAADPGAIARRAEDRKCEKYSGLSSTYLFTPVSVETSGVLGPKTKNFLRKLGALMTLRSADPRETHWLAQRISIAVLRGNTFSIRSALSG